MLTSTKGYISQIENRNNELEKIIQSKKEKEYSDQNMTYRYIHQSIALHEAKLS
jgi:hypothetical protein